MFGQVHIERGRGEAGHAVSKVGLLVDVEAANREDVVLHCLQVTFIVMLELLPDGFEIYVLEAGGVDVEKLCGVELVSERKLECHDSILLNSCWFMKNA